MAKIERDVIDAAQASERKHGIPASVSLAQFGLESAWGTKMPAGSNNPFGIKAVNSQPSVTVRTREVDSHGRSYYIQAPFRKFASIAEAFEEHGRLLAQAKPYARARTKLPNADAFADALTGVYATDPKYGELLRKIMRQSKLYQYNAAPAAQPVAAPVPAELIVPTPPIAPDDSVKVAEANRAELARVQAATVSAPVTTHAAAMALSRDTVNEVLAAAPASVIEHVTEGTKLKLGEKSTWIGGAIVVASLVADPTVQAAARPVWNAVQHGSWGGILSAAIGLGLVVARSRSTPRTDAVIAAKRLIAPAA
ncbi:Flagellum-specific peptidoglycan hydrolase FlgJ [Sphingomonas gellani]|uniref:Flagellum-specific peptidoglycan hydrolase FlgJ n=1 Tax=Sphingomonas gellani TaxID=1166340 RepID=A0A1H8EAZ1_9SPHN|nr:glucosaminidase domain-containing protein [Sphingomonas gellani]SEN16662.1 Flagellum-specific peptidoglycan hydrolase FlgJ [Sphingomonas gellani]